MAKYKGKRRVLNISSKIKYWSPEQINITGESLFPSLEKMHQLLLERPFITSPVFIHPDTYNDLLNDRADGERRYEQV